MWPYSYDTCDLGTFPNQTDKNGNPAAAATGGLGGGPLSNLPGQKLSSCSCPGSDHPGPFVNTGRGVPEIDILEVQIATEDDFQPEVSQSYQTAPFDLNYIIQDNLTTIYNSNTTVINSYHGGPFQEAVSRVSEVDSALYNDSAYGIYGFEWWSDPNDRDSGYITWFSNPDGQSLTKTWTLTSPAIGPNSGSQVSQRLISEEPHVCPLHSVRLCLFLCSCLIQTIVINLGMSRESRLCVPCLL